MYLEERKQDLFKMSNDYFLVHCISADFALGAGIAKDFNEKFNIKNKLMQRHGNLRFKLSTVGTCILVDKVFNLVTKQRCFGKPTYDNLVSSLKDMKNICNLNRIKKLAMPRIGCGLDKLDWNKVRQIILDTFEDTDIEIVVCVKE